MHCGAWRGGTSKCQAARAHVEGSRHEGPLLISPLHLCLPHSWGLAPVDIRRHQHAPVLPTRLGSDRPMLLLQSFYCKAKSNNSRGRGRSIGSCRGEVCWVPGWFWAVGGGGHRPATGRLEKLAPLPHPNSRGPKTL